MTNLSDKGLTLRLPAILWVPRSLMWEIRMITHPYRSIIGTVQPKPLSSFGHILNRSLGVDQ